MDKVVAYRRVWGVCCSEPCCQLRRCDGYSLAEIRGAEVYVGRHKVGYVAGYVADAPYPPFRNPGGGWSRLLTAGHAQTYLLHPEVAGPISIPKALPPPRLLALFYKLDPALYASPHWNKVSIKSTERLPGQGRLVGEEFRIVEVDNDYLRLVGRGGDEYLAWDFVLGTLDSGEWVLLGEDGLYVARREGERVVVREPYRGEIYYVRGPPYAPFYPVVPVKWVRERLGEVWRRAGRHEAKVYRPPVDLVYLLKWPLVAYKWEFKIVVNLREEVYPVYVQL